MDAMKHNRFDVARMTLQTLINTIRIRSLSRAKLAVADSWYAEAAARRCSRPRSNTRIPDVFSQYAGGAEAQLKVANIHYQEMEKADRDYTTRCGRRRNTGR